MLVSSMTGLKDLRTVAVSGGSHNRYAHSSTTQTMHATRSYALKLTESSGRTRVTATPRVFINGQNVSDRPVWSLRGPQGEPVMWKQLFDEIQSNL